MNSNKKGSIALASLLALAGAGAVVDTAEAAAYLKLGDIKGEAKLGIPVLQWAWAAATQNGGRKGDSACFFDIQFSKKLDASTSQMLEALAAQVSFPNATLTVVNDADQSPVLELELRPAQLTSYDVSSDGSLTLIENFSLRFSDANGIIPNSFAAPDFLISGQPCN